MMAAQRRTAELHNLLGNVEERAGNSAGADRGVSSAPRTWRPPKNTCSIGATTCCSCTRSRDATKVFTPAIARHPQSARLHVGLGIAHYSRGSTKTPSSRSVRRRDLAPPIRVPTSFSARCTAWRPRWARRSPGAWRDFAKAQPRNAQAQFHYAMSLWKGQPDGSPSPNLRQVEALLRRAVTLDVKLREGASSSSAFCSRTSSGIPRRFRSCGTPRGSRPTWRRRTTACRRRINGPARRSWRRRSSSCSSD